MILGLQGKKKGLVKDLSKRQMSTTNHRERLRSNQDLCDDKRKRC
jgi:hypothetical protein